MNKATSNGSRTAIQVLVRAPNGKVDIPIMHLQWYIADRMCQIPTNDDAFALRVLSDGRDVEELARVKLDSGKQQQRGFRSMIVDY